MPESSCSTTMSRRNFLSGCACACTGCAASGLLSPQLLRAKQPAAGKPKICLVFCETANDKPIWPNIGYDFDTRRKQVIDALTQGCPDLQISVTTSMDDPADADRILKNSPEADGYVVCLQGLGWRNDVPKLCSSGKPTLLVDNLFGGSGKFLTQLPHIMNSGKPVDWVSSSCDQDIVAAARQFCLVSEGKTPSDIAAAFRASRRERTPAETDWTCEKDAIESRDFAEALEELKQKKILVVGGGWGGDPFREAAKQILGVTFIPIGFEELAAACKEADPEAAKAFADQWMTAADFRGFIDAQDAAGQAYLDTPRWTRMSILNTANSGRFSTDRTMRDYNEDIWHLQPIAHETS